MRLARLEDWILVAAMLLAAIADNLGLDPRYTLYALILGGIAKGLLSIISREEENHG